MSIRIHINLTLFNRIFVILLLFFTSNVSAMWVKMSDCDLIEKSSLIVHAEYTGITRNKLSNIPESFELGVLQISRVYKGNKTLDTVLVEQPDPAAPRSSNDIFFTKGQIGIWFLTERKNTLSEIYSANHYQRFWSIDNLQKLDNLLDSCSKPE